MQIRRRKTLGASALAVAVGVAVLAPGAAHGAVDSHVTLHIKNGHHFYGRVSSPADECVVGRKVQLRRREPDGSTTKVAKTFASESGHYGVNIPMQNGNTFVARLKSYEAPGGTLCRRAHSEPRTA
jgi:hypothetical protein